jgi:regulator of protease activity HflC (stomatin/prohibitin superfamily)
MIINYSVAIPLLFLLVASVRIANQYERAVIFQLGKYARTSGPGLYLLIPLIEWQATIDMRTMTTAVEQQEAITRDNVPIKINAVIWRRTIDPQRSVIEVADVGNSVVQVAVMALRNVIGQHTLDDVLKEQETISRALQITIDQVTEPWGVKVERVQMITEVGAEQNTMTIIMMPSEFVEMARALGQRAGGGAGSDTRI